MSETGSDLLTALIWHNAVIACPIEKGFIAEGAVQTKLPAGFIIAVQGIHHRTAPIY
jgi:hypothetical protein